ncbi:hypothetical protein LRN74_24955, partial [Escherichia coli]
FEGAARSESDPYVIVDAQTGELSVHTQTGEAELFVDRYVQLASGSVRVKSSLLCLKEEAFKYDLAFYSEQCEI